MTTPDAASVAQLAVQLRLVTDEQLRECWDELDTAEHSPEALLKLLERKNYLTPWQSHKLLRGDTDGYILGGHRVLYKIASGSFGRVFRADDPRTGAVVAIKILRRRWSEDPHKVELFDREGRVGMSMHHPNIVRILAVSQDRATGQYFIVMEFVEGGNLRDFLRVRKRLEPAEALLILEECAAALAYAYMRGLTHRDLKPTNVLIASQGVAKLVDFGLAEIAIPQPGEDYDVTVDRTVDYAGLERATAVKHGDVRSDVFFMGCVFYEMLCGHTPLTQTRDRVARMHRNRYENIAPISTYGVELPPPVQRLLDRMIAFDPQARFQTPAQLHEAVRKVQGEMEGTPTGKMAPTGPKSVFVVEGHPRLQDIIRERFSAAGLRVLIAQDPQRAVNRYEEQPYHAIIVDAGTAGQAGVQAFKKIIRESDDLDLSLVGILLLDREQADWVDQVPARPGFTAMIRPVSYKQLYDKLSELMEPEQGVDEDEPEADETEAEVDKEQG
jgi:tRNA A-37 threonylcarbamoyl transferase component Bud32